MATDHLTNTVSGLVETLQAADELNDYLTAVWPYYSRRATVERNKVTIHIIVGNSTSEIPITDCSTNTDILPTEIALVCDTKLDSDADIFDAEIAQTLLDHEYRVLRALQSAAYWGTSGDNHGWEVSGVVRDEPVYDGAGALDPDIRRFVITISVDVSFDRTDGPAR